MVGGCWGGRWRGPDGGGVGGWGCGGGEPGASEGGGQGTGLLGATRDGKREILEGEPVNWRVFNQSKHYAGHLNVVRPDSLHVLAFTNDFEVDQRAKVAGIRYRRRRPIRALPRFLL